MNFVTTKEALLKPLQQVAGVIERRQTLPVLANVLVVANDQGVQLTGTDLEVEMTASLSMDVHAPGSVTVPARKLLEIWRQLPDSGQVSVAVEGDQVVVRAGRFRSALSTLPVTDYPKPELTAPEISVEVGPKALRKLLDQTAFAMAQQDVRFFLNGMLLEFGSGYLRSVATDGHRLALANASASVTVGALKQIIVPRKGVSELTRLLGEVEQEFVRVEVGSSHLRVELAELSFSTKLIDGRFPDYDRVIPRGGDHVALGERIEFAQVLGRISIFSNEKYRAARLRFSPGVVMLSANNAEHESAEESCDVEFDGESTEAGFNARYLEDVMGALSGRRVRFTLHLNGSAVIEDPDVEDALYVIMPIKL